MTMISYLTDFRRVVQANATVTGWQMGIAGTAIAALTAIQSSYGFLPTTTWILGKTFHSACATIARARAEMAILFAMTGGTPCGISDGDMGKEGSGGSIGFGGLGGANGFWSLWATTPPAFNSLTITSTADAASVSPSLALT
jgi:hypothetical protein